MRRDPRLQRVNTLARILYAKGDLPLHNYEHALWDTKMAIQIAERESHPNISLPIASALMHDSGVSRGPYQFHAKNGAYNVNKYLPALGFSPLETEEIAQAVFEHNGWDHNSDTAKILYDADTLNKAGAHGIGQCQLVGIERNLSLEEMTTRFLPLFEKLVAKGLYTKTAREINQMKGTIQYTGLEVTLQFWKRIDALIKFGHADDHHMIYTAQHDIGVA